MECKLMQQYMECKETICSFISYLCNCIVYFVLISRMWINYVYFIFCFCEQSFYRSIKICDIVMLYVLALHQCKCTFWMLPFLRKSGIFCNKNHSIESVCIINYLYIRYIFYIQQIKFCSIVLMLN